MVPAVTRELLTPPVCEVFRQATPRIARRMTVDLVGRILHITREQSGPG